MTAEYSSRDVIPVTALIVTKNEAAQIKSCIAALKDFSQIIVVDSASTDETCALAKQSGAEIVNFAWNGVYPKKRQWCLDNVKFKHDWVFMVDADEITTDDFIAELKALFKNGMPARDGYFVKGQYVAAGKKLSFGLQNNKLALFNRRKFSYPVVDDLEFPGMGEIEGHYQPCPVIKSGAIKIGQVKAPLFHYAIPSWAQWKARHIGYAKWEARMAIENAWPEDPVSWRQTVKRLLRALPIKPHLMFLHSYILKLGFLDGKAGLRFAKSRFHYYRLVAQEIRALKLS